MHHIRTVIANVPLAVALANTVMLGSAPAPPEPVTVDLPHGLRDAATRLELSDASMLLAFNDGRDTRRRERASMARLYGVDSTDSMQSQPHHQAWFQGAALHLRHRPTSASAQLLQQLRDYSSDSSRISSLTDTQVERLAVLCISRSDGNCFDALLTTGRVSEHVRQWRKHPVRFQVDMRRFLLNVAKMSRMSVTATASAAPLWNAWHEQLAHEPLLDVVDAHGNSALFTAISEGSVPALRALLEAGADPNITDHMGNGPLHRVATMSVSATTAVTMTERSAATEDRLVAEATAMAELLLKHGSDPLRKNLAGATALYEAQRGGNMMVSRMMRLYHNGVAMTV